MKKVHTCVQQYDLLRTCNLHTMAMKVPYGATAPWPDFPFNEDNTFRLSLPKRWRIL